MEEKLLKDYSDQEKGAYFVAIASIATADDSATEEELQHLTELADAAELSPQQRASVVSAAQEQTGQELKRSLETLKNSDLRFSLMADLISFAKSDNHYSPDEKAYVQKIGTALNLNQQQFDVLDEFVERASGQNLQSQPEVANSPSFLSGLGLENKFQNAGINMGSIGKGLLAILGPMLIGKMLSGRRSGSGMGGGLGGGLGDLLGQAGGGGGLGSILGNLSGGRGFQRSGGFLGKILGF